MLKEVSKEDFFKVIGPLDVNPYPQGKWDNLGGIQKPLEVTERQTCRHI